MGNLCSVCEVSLLARRGVSESYMGPQDPKDVTRDTARDLSALVGELAALKADATHWLTYPEYAALRNRLEAAHAAVEAAPVEAGGRVRLNEERGGRQGS
jgi:hypothetical protein